MLILLGGLFPQPGVSSRYKAAMDILDKRKAVFGSESTGQPEEDEELPSPPSRSHVESGR